ncbi:Mbov_0121 family peptidase domain-containing ABC transporter [Mycoplasma marinum]|uniref:Mbov_0121 family peptidase domain-containing ABC transporter n=1 Tax=Mycoplasma marinum TaxID=1937190 RepID=UPI003B29B1D6
MKIKKQDDIKDCGLTILQAFHAHFYNRWININEMKQKALYGTKGINVEGICSIGKAFGMKLTPMKGDFDSFKGLKIKNPIIALIGNTENNHYVIVNRITKRSVHISDPLTGQEEVLNLEKFGIRFLGVIIYVEKSQYIHKRIKIRSLYEYVFQFKRLIPFVFISSIISVIIMFSSSWFMKIIMDQIIPGALSNTLETLFAGFISLSILGIINRIFRNYIIYKISLQISIEITEKFNKKLMETPYLSISKLSKSDIIRRASFIETLSLFLSSAIFSIFSEIITCIVASFVLIWIDEKLFYIAIITSFLLVFTTIITQKILNKKYSSYIKTQIKQASCNLDVLDSLKRARQTDTKDLFLMRQTKTLYNFKKQDKAIWNINNLHSFAQSIIRVISPMIVIFLATNAVISHELSLGSLILFISMFSFFIEPTLSLTSVFIKYPLVKKEMDMLSFVLEIPNEKLNPKGAKLEILKNIELKNVIFYYEEGKDIINTKNYKIDNHLRIRGKNGSGKSTLFDLLSTTIHVKGIFLNGIETKYYDLRQVRDETFVTSPNSYILKTNVLEYATENNLKRQEVFIKNFKNYKLDKMFLRMGLELDQSILGNAENISSGQRQMVQLLPLFSKKFKLILLDEAFENLDDKISTKLMEGIKQYQNEAIFIEISHSGKYIQKSKEVSIEKFK